MKEINLIPGQFVNLSAQGLPNTKLLLQNQGKDGGDRDWKFVF